jgi:hypothetical protein
VRFAHDPTTAAAGNAGPGNDTRQWLSYALVDADTPNAHNVLFTNDDGADLPYPLVLVTLQPSGISVAARVGAHVAGKGESSWRPFVAGDEVLVAIPEGDERAGPVIIQRLNQGRDTFPATVGGVDVTKNTTAFDRYMAPYVLESGTAILLRNAAMASYLSLDITGNATLANSDGHYLALHHDLLSMQTFDGSCMVQIDPSLDQVYLQAGPTNLVLDSAGNSAFLSPGTLSLVTSGGGYAPGHAITVEQVANILSTFLTLASAAATAPPALVAFFAAFASPTTLAGLFTAAAANPLLTPVTTAISAALASAPPDPTGVAVGIGRPGLLL